MMELFLKIVGALVVAFVICLVILMIAIRLWLKSLAKSLVGDLEGAMKGLIASASTVPPLRVKLMRLEDHEWGDAAAIEKLTDQLERAGFAVIGDFDVDPAMMELRALVHEEHRCYAVIYEHPVAGIWFDICSLQEDLTATMTVSTGQQNLLDRKDGHPLVTLDLETPPEEALRTFLTERRNIDWDSATASRFVPLFERAYASEMDWRVRRGGPTSDEVRRIAEQDGSEFQEEMVESIQYAWKTQAAETYNDELFENFRDQADMSPREWESVRDRLIFVHDYTVMENLADDLEYLSEEYDDDEPDSPTWTPSPADIEELRKISKSADQRKSFADFAKKHGLSAFRYLKTIDAPITADVYVGPEDC